MPGATTTCTARARQAMLVCAEELHTFRVAKSLMLHAARASVAWRKLTKSRFECWGRRACRLMTSAMRGSGASPQRLPYQDAIRGGGWQTGKRCKEEEEEEEEGTPAGPAHNAALSSAELCQ